MRSAIVAARSLVVAAAVTMSCGGSKTPTTSTPTPPTFTSTADRILPLLPDGAQIVVEIDLARLRANPVVGALVTELLAGDDVHVPTALSDAVPTLPLAKADTLVMASYGVGTSNAATVTILATPDPIAHGVQIADNLVALGPPEWTAQIEARAAIYGVSGANITPTLAAPKELRDLRDHAMPEKAPGASLRITARLPFDARVALGRVTGLDTPPAQLSVWGDVVDDLVIIIDLDAADPGDKKSKSSTKRMEVALRAMLGALANELPVRALGLSPSIEGTEIVTRGTWLRAIVAVGPKRLARVIERAKTYLAAPPPAPAAPGSDPS